MVVIFLCYAKHEGLSCLFVVSSQFLNCTRSWHCAAHRQQPVRNISHDTSLATDNEAGEHHLWLVNTLSPPQGAASFRRGVRFEEYNRSPDTSAQTRRLPVWCETHRVQQKPRHCHNDFLIGRHVSCATSRNADWSLLIMAQEESIHYAERGLVVSLLYNAHAKLLISLNT
jgi:hypothetical protein